MPLRWSRAGCVRTTIPNGESRRPQEPSRREPVLISDAMRGAARFHDVELVPTANGAVLSVRGAPDAPGTSLVFFDLAGTPTILQ